LLKADTIPGGKYESNFITLFPRIFVLLLIYFKTNKSTGESQNDKKRTDVEKIREILRLCLELNYSLRDAAIALGVSKTTVGEYIAEFKRTGLSYKEITQMCDTEVIELFDKSNKSSSPLYEELSMDFEYIEKELKRPGVTLYLLWEEYRQRQNEGFSYSRFCHHYRMWERRQAPDMHMNHKAGGQKTKIPQGRLQKVGGAT
jgi:transposase